MRLVFIYILSMMASLSALAQKVKRVEGEYTYVAPKNVTQEYAVNYAIEQARKTAIANEFGTLVSQTSTTRIENVDGQSKANVTLIGENELNGIWLEDIEEPVVRQEFIDNTFVVTAKVRGKARERSLAEVEFNYTILRNGKDDRRNESDQFRSGDDMYLSFQSPVDGYVAVYLVDADDQAFCLLPYRGQREGIYRVKANQRYLFFSSQEAPVEEQAVVDEYQMTCERSDETNRIYVVFSPNEFTKAVDESADSQLPRQLSFEDFQKWLSKCRIADKRMSSRHRVITVQK